MVRNVSAHYDNYFELFYGIDSKFIDTVSAMRSKAKYDLRSSINFLAQIRGLTSRLTNTAAHLYTSQGHNPIPMESLKDSGLAPLTRWTQKYISQHQNPTQCEGAIFLITNGYDSGMGSEMHVTSSHLAFAIQNNLILTWGPHSCRRFVVTNLCNKGCACLYRHLSSCSSDAYVNHNIHTWNSIDHGNHQRLIPDVFRNAVRSQNLSMAEDELLYWWRTQAVGFLMRFNDDTISQLSKMRKTDNLNYMSGHSTVPFPLPVGTVSAHIRLGDKFTEMQLVPPEYYVTAFQSMIRNMPNSYSRTLFVSSDDEDAVQTCRGLTENLNMTYIYTRLTRMSGGHQLGVWDNTRSEAQHALVLGHLLQLLMALEADAWIGTRGSNWNRLIDELRCVWVDKCQHTYVEVGSVTGGSYEW
jgi:hypothetical protein